MYSLFLIFVIFKEILSMNLYTDNLKKGLKRARERAGLTQDELAGKMGVSTKTIRNWEQKVKANTLPTMENLLKLADLYDCDLDYLTGRIECKTHDLQFIHDQTGLTEEAIIKIKELSAEQLTALNQLIEHQDFKKAISQTAALSDKEAINADLGAMIIHHFKSGLADKKTVPVQGNMIEKSMLFTLSNLLTRIICDITETEL